MKTLSCLCIPVVCIQYYRGIMKFAWHTMYIVICEGLFEYYQSALLLTCVAPGVEIYTTCSPLRTSLQKL